MYKTLVNDGINHQPQLHGRSSEPSTGFPIHIDKLCPDCFKTCLFQTSSGSTSNFNTSLERLVKIRRWIGSLPHGEMTCVKNRCRTHHGQRVMLHFKGGRECGGKASEKKAGCFLRGGGNSTISPEI